MVLPPGWARLATKPPPTGSLAKAKTMGMGDGGPVREDHIYRLLDKLGRDLGITLGTIRPTMFEYNGAALDPIECFQPLYKRCDPRSEDCRVSKQEADDRQLDRRLSSRGEWPSNRAANERNECAPSHELVSLGEFRREKGNKAISHAQVVR